MSHNHGNQRQGDQNLESQGPSDTTDSNQVVPAVEVDPRDAGLGHLVTAYADGELAPEDVARVEQILAKDPGLGIRLAEIRLLQGALRTGLSASPPPVQLEEMALGRILAAAARPQQPRRRGLTLMRLSMAALILLGVGITISSLATRTRPPSAVAIPSASPEDAVAVRDQHPGKTALPSLPPLSRTSAPGDSEADVGPETVASAKFTDEAAVPAREAAPARSLRSNPDEPKNEPSGALAVAAASAPAAAPAPATTPAAAQAVPSDLPGAQSEVVSAVVAEKSRPAASVPRALVTPQRSESESGQFLAVGAGHVAKPSADGGQLVAQAYLDPSERPAQRSAMRSRSAGRVRVRASLRSSLAALPELSGPTAGTLGALLQQIAGAECPIQVTPAAAAAMSAPARRASAP